MTDRATDSRQRHPEETVAATRKNWRKGESIRPHGEQVALDDRPLREAGDERDDRSQF